MSPSLPAAFSELTPIDRPPTLTTINGIGTTVMGGRDFDAQTNTYVKTQFFTFVFLPLFALGAYRVADAPGEGWYFLGRVPLSPVCRNFNFLMGGALLGLVGCLPFM